VDQFFLHFEKLAEQCKLEKKIWVLLIQGKFTGKAQEVYAALDIEASMDYDVVKTAILNAYELVPEAYRQKFRNCRKVEGQTYVEFARQKENLFDRWCKAKKVDSFDKLRQLVLVEEFKKCTYNDLRTYLDERQVNSLDRAASLADEYSLTHKSSFKSQRGQEKKDGVPVQASKAKESSVERKGENDSASQENGVKRKFVYKKCNFCKKPGHVTEECWHLKNRSEQKSEEKAVALVSGIDVGYAPFVSEGFVSQTENDDLTSRKVSILRDTGASQSLLLENTVPTDMLEPTGESVLVKGVFGDYESIPLYKIYLESPLVSGPVVVGVMSKLPVDNVSLLLGNDLAGGTVFPIPHLTERPETNENLSELEEKYPSVFADCVVTRSMKEKAKVDVCDDKSPSLNLSETFMATLDEVRFPVADKNSDNDHNEEKVLSRDHLILEQNRDPGLVSIVASALSEEEAKHVPVCYYIQDQVLMRKWRPPQVPANENWKVVNQVVVPKVYRRNILNLAHDNPVAGHLGVNKTYDRIQQYFYWPGLKNDVSHYCKSCHVCQVVGKPNQKIPKAPLIPIPVIDEPFSRVIVDCVGPLPRTRSGNEYLLTVMCSATRFPEAIPLRNIKAPTISKALVKFFTLVGLPRSIQSDQGTNFLSGIFTQVVKELGISHVKSSAYHPESQGALERFHQTFKNMLRMYCLENNKDWDEGVHLLLFATREVVQDSLGFSPFELVFGHSVRGPLMLCKEQMLSKESESHSLLKYVVSFKERLLKACEAAKDNLCVSQGEMKTWYDKKARLRTFSPDEQVLVLLPTSGNALQARYHGPYTIKRKISDVSYLVNTPERKKKVQLCHINMLKKYHTRENAPSEQTVAFVVQGVESEKEEKIFESDAECPISEPPGATVKMKNSEILSTLDKKLDHLLPDQQKDITDLIHEYSALFPDIPSRTTVIEHDVDVGNSEPVKQHPYRVNPVKAVKLNAEVKFMLQNEMIEPSHSQWSSPCLLVPKPDNSFRFCTDYRRVNLVTKVDAYPMKRVDDCVDKVGKAKYVSKFDLLKGYWQVPLTERAVEVSAFVVPDGFYQYKVMPFGMRNASATFQRMMNTILWEVDGCDVYIDDVVIVSDNWKDHVQRIRMMFDKLLKANLSINLAKCEFGKATLIFLGHVVGQGQVKPVHAKIESIVNFPTPTNKREVMRFLGIAGYYRKFCSNFADIVNPLTELLGKGKEFQWSDACQESFDRVKAVLSNSPVLITPDFQKQFRLSVDASDIGVGAVLSQEDDSGIDHPVAYFSKKLDKHQRNYSTIEKETLAIVLALSHFDVYLCCTVEPILVYTDHNPLVFLHRMKNQNQRILRWSLLLQGYNIDIKYVQGKHNVVADALSRS